MKTRYFLIVPGILLACVTLSLKGCDEKDEINNSVGSIEPSSGVVGDLITMTGTFAPDAQVTIDDKPVTVIQRNPESIKLKIPDSFTAGLKSIHVGRGANADQVAFELHPALTAIQVPALTHNDATIIKGTGFSATPTQNQILFGTTPVAVLEATTTELKIRVPANLELGNTKVSGVVAQLESDSELDVIIYGWRKQTTHPRGGFDYGVSFSIGDNLFFLFCRNNTGTFGNEMWRFNLKTSEWKRMMDFPAETRLSATTFALNGKGYAGLGYGLQGGQLNDWWEYDPAVDNWQRMPDFPGQGRTGQCSFDLGGIGYVGLGISNGIISHNDFYKYNPVSKEWTRLGDYPGGNLYGAGTMVLGTKAYVVGGVINNDQNYYGVFEYNSTSDTWVQKRDFPGDTSVDLKGFGLGQAGIVGLGWVNSNNASSRIWRYTAESNTWQEDVTFPGEARFSFCNGTSGQFGYYGLGYLGNTLQSDIWIYLPKP